MNISTKSVSTFASTLLARLVLGFGVCGVAIGITSTLLSQPASALPPASEQPLGDFTNPSSERDSFSGNIGGSDISIFDLIHRAQTGGLQDSGAFSQDKRREIDSAVDDFRRQQLERLGKPAPVAPATTDTTVPAPN
jgi:hypothetical protein